MRIGVDARNLVPKLSGIGRYVGEMGRHLAELGHEVYFYLPEPPSMPEVIPAGVTVNVSNYIGAFPRIFWGHAVLPKLILEDKVDVFWGPAHRLPSLSAMEISQVVTIHDLVWQHASSTMRTPNWFSERIFMKPAVAKADRVIAVSSSTSNAVSALWPWAASRIEVIYPGCTPFPAGAPKKTLQKHGIDRPFILFVGTLEPRKNLIRLLEAFSHLPDSVRANYLLVIAGGQGWGLDDLQTAISSLGITCYVCLTGFVSDAELGDLYSSAKFLAMPSLYEGFGFPIIEANSAGVPVLTSNSSSMPEVGGDAALLVDATDVSSIEIGLERLICDSEFHAKLALAARPNAARFNWRDSAIALARVFETTVLSKERKHRL